jgi:4-aminobutyrate aminotransferase / (S)-3-amino-2-methylpropionate transaminase
MMQPYRVFNTWLGDPSKVILLEEVVGAIRDLNLLDNAKSTGSALVNGMKQLQV